MNIPRLLVGGFLALGVVGLTAEAAQAQYYGSRGYNNRFSGGSGFNNYGRSAYSSQYFNSGFQPSYGQFYRAPQSRSYYNSGYNQGYNRGYNYNPYGYRSGSSFSFSFGRGYR